GPPPVARWRLDGRRQGSASPPAHAAPRRRGLGECGRQLPAQPAGGGPRALRWIRERMAEYGGDPDFVVVTGGSAGGHLAALLALTPNDPEFQPGFEDVDTSVTACVPFYGVYDLGEGFGA